MNLDLPIFNIKPLKETFFQFFSIHIILLLLSFVFIGLGGDVRPNNFIQKDISWLFIFLLFGSSLLYGRATKKKLRDINQLDFLYGHFPIATLLCFFAKKIYGYP